MSFFESLALPVGLLAFLSAGLGAFGGLGGAILLVPALILLGLSPVQAAPLGLLAVAAGSVAAGSRQAGEGLINHRLGVAMEVPSSVGAVVGALLGPLLAERLLVLVLAAAAAAAGVIAPWRSGIRNVPDHSLDSRDVGERLGSLSGAYPLDGSVVPYSAKRVPLAGIMMGVAGCVAGLTGVSGGFLKTPVMSELMHIPVKVAAATTVFVVGLTAAAGLIVYALQGRIEIGLGAAVVAGGLLGGVVGAFLQTRFGPSRIRRALSGVLLVIALVLVVQA